MKKNNLYLYILLSWVLLVFLSEPFLLPPLIPLQHKSTFIFLIGILNTLFILYFWLNGMKDVVYTCFYWLKKDSLLPTVTARTLIAQPLVYLIYTTCNDFDQRSLQASMKQDYTNFKVFILDDSSEDEKIQEVADFANRYNIPVLRRKNRIGFKAGNLNNFLLTAKCDYFVLLDSDEIIPANFIKRSLDYFAYYRKAGIVQANHTATRNRNRFMRKYAIGVNSHWNTYQSVKNTYGFLSLLGHGAMVSMKCFTAVGGFPELVAEDLCFSIEARNKNYYTVFAKDILCEEEFPIDYLAFKKRHNKWTQGNMEFIKKYSGKILTSHMKWFEKLDIFLFCYNLPLTAVFSLYIVINIVILPLFGDSIIYHPVLLIPTILFLLAPMLNDIIFYARKISFISLLVYLFLTMLLYGSMFFISFRASIISFFGKAVFIVTPKHRNKINMKQSIMVNRSEICFAVLLLLISITIDKSIFPVLLIAFPSFASIYLTTLADHE